MVSMVVVETLFDEKKRVAKTRLEKMLNFVFEKPSQGMLKKKLV